MKFFSNPVTWIVASMTFNALAAIAVAGVAWTTLRQQDQQLETLKAWQTGGDSYGYYQPLLQRGHRLGFFIRHQGGYPAFDVIVRIHEVQAGQGHLIEGPFTVGTLTRGSGMDWISPPSLRAFQDPPPRGTQPRAFRIEIQARNGVVVQRLRLWAVDGRWHTESKDITLPNGSRVEPEFLEAQDQ